MQSLYENTGGVTACSSHLEVATYEAPQVSVYAESALICEEPERGGRPANELDWTRIWCTWGVWVLSRLQSQTSAISKFKFACLLCTLIIATGGLISGQWGGN